MKGFKFKGSGLDKAFRSIDKSVSEAAGLTEGNKISHAFNPESEHHKDTMNQLKGTHVDPSAAEEVARLEAAAREEAARLDAARIESVKKLEAELAIAEAARVAEIEAELKAKAEVAENAANLEAASTFDARVNEAVRKRLEEIKAEATTLEAMIEAKFKAEEAARLAEIEVESSKVKAEEAAKLAKMEVIMIEAKFKAEEESRLAELEVEAAKFEARVTELVVARLAEIEAIGATHEEKATVTKEEVSQLEAKKVVDRENENVSTQTITGITDAIKKWGNTLIGHKHLTTGDKFLLPKKVNLEESKVLIEYISEAIDNDPDYSDLIGEIIELYPS